MKRFIVLFWVIAGSAAAEPSWYHSDWRSGDTLYTSVSVDDPDGNWVSAYAEITGPTNSGYFSSCNWYSASVAPSVPVIVEGVWTITKWAVAIAASWYATQSAELKKPITNFKKRSGSTLCWYDEACSEAGGTPICGIGDFEVNTACTSNLKIQYKAFRFGTGAYSCYSPTETPISSPVACTGG